MVFALVVGLAASDLVELDATQCHEVAPYFVNCLKDNNEVVPTTLERRKHEND
jgi:hypothetical protein